MIARVTLATSVGVLQACTTSRALQPPTQIETPAKRVAPRGFGVVRPVGAVVIRPGDDAARVVNAVTVPTTFWFAPGVHVLSAPLTMWAGHTLLGGAGSVISVGSNEMAVRGSVDGVTIRGLTFDGGQARDQRATVEAFEAKRWTISGNEIRNGRAFGVFAGAYTTVSGNWIHDNGQGGVKAWAPGSGADGVVVTGNEISSNNTRRVNVFWEAGGFKMVSGSSAVVSGNWFHDNWGWGVWFDYTGGNHQVVDNTFERESFGGVTYEASGPGTQIAYNTFIGCGFVADAESEPRVIWSGAVYVFAAPVEIHHNVGVDNRGTVGFLQSPRDNDAKDPYRYSIAGSSVHDNDWTVKAGVRGVTGMKVNSNADWAPYPSFGQSYLDAFTNAVTFSRNTYRGIAASTPSINYWEPGGLEQRFLWGDVSVSPTKPGTNPKTWTSLHPNDGPYN